jgi:uncharacterized protein YqgQ
VSYRTINTVKKNTEILLVATKKFGIVVYAKKSKYTCMFMRRHLNVVV